MHLELKDLQTGLAYRVGAEGATLGRDPSRCTIVIGDKGVSGVHARISVVDERFVLEDQRSSNGTFAGADRLTEPFELYSGATFGLFRYRFEVVLVAIGDDEDTGALGKPGETPVTTNVGPVERRAEVAPSRSQRAKTSSRAGPLNTASQVASASIVPPTAVGASVSGVSGSRSDPRHAPTSMGPAMRRGRERDTTTLLPLAALAAAYYSHYLPKLVLHPTEEVEASILDARHAALTPLALVGWALPAFLFAAFCAGLGTCVTQLAQGESVLRLLVVMIFALALGGASSVLSGLLWHPVAGFTLELLGAEHDAAARSNLFVGLMTTVPAVGFGWLATSVFGSLPVPFLAIVGVALTLGALVLLLYVLYAWLRSLQASTLGLGLVWALAALVVLGAAWNGALLTRAQLAIAADVGPPDPGLPGAAVAVPAPSVALPVTPAVAPTIAATARSGASPAAASPYPEYVRRRDAIERAIEADPSLLKRGAGVLDLYRRLHTESGKVEERHPKAGEDLVAKRLRDAELYEATSGIVDQLYLLVSPGR